MKLRPLHDDVLICPEQDLRHGLIELLTTTESSHRGRVLAVGPAVYGISVGDTVLVEGGSIKGGVEAPGGRLVSQDICLAVL